MSRELKLFANEELSEEWEPRFREWEEMIDNEFDAEIVRDGEKRKQVLGITELEIPLDLVETLQPVMNYIASSSRILDLVSEEECSGKEEAEPLQMEAKMKLQRLVFSEEMKSESELGSMIVRKKHSVLDEVSVCSTAATNEVEEHFQAEFEQQPRNRRLLFGCIPVLKFSKLKARSVRPMNKS